MGVLGGNPCSRSRGIGAPTMEEALGMPPRPSFLKPHFYLRRMSLPRFIRCFQLNG